MKISLRFFSIIFFFQSFLVFSDSQSRTYKILLLGERNSGKTSFLRAVFDEEFRQESYPSAGIDVRRKLIDDTGSQTFFTFYDLGAPETVQKFLMKYYAQEMDGFILFFDLSDEDSLNNLTFWKEISEGKPRVLVGNKKNLPRKHVFSDYDARIVSEGFESFDCISIKEDTKEAIESPLRSLNMVFLSGSFNSLLTSTTKKEKNKKKHLRGE